MIHNWTANFFWSEHCSVWIIAYHSLEVRENEGENMKVRMCPCPVGCPCCSQGLHCSDFTGLCHIWYRKKDHGLGTLQSGVCRVMKTCRQEELRWGTHPAFGVKILRKQQDVCLNVLVSNQGDGSRDGEKLSDLEVFWRGSWQDVSTD